MRIACTFLAALCLQAPAQEPKKKPSSLSADEEKRLLEAVKKGVEYLRAQEKTLLTRFTFNSRSMNHSELALWTLISAGVPLRDPLFQVLFKDMIARKLEATLPVALQAMIVEHLDRVRFQWRLQQCAQFLVDSQPADGSWSYGDPSIFVEDIPEGNAKLPDAPQNPKVAKRLTVEKKRDGPGRGDAWNSFIAALGLRACQDGGINIKEEFVQLARQRWRELQKNDKNWQYDEIDGTPSASATAGAVASLLVFGSLLKSDGRKDAMVLSGTGALAKLWNPTERMGVKGSSVYHYAGLYTVGCAMIFLGQDKLGTVDWYADGVQSVLAAQNADGSWGAAAAALPGVNNNVYASNPIWDTCFAMLFLSHGVRPLSEPAKKK